MIDEIINVYLYKGTEHFIATSRDGHAYQIAPPLAPGTVICDRIDSLHRNYMQQPEAAGLFLMKDGRSLFVEEYKKQKYHILNCLRGVFLAKPESAPSGRITEGSPQKVHYLEKYGKIYLVERY